MTNTNTNTAEPSYDELLAQRDELDRKLASLREQEVARAIVEIRERMAKLGITLADLARGEQLPQPANKRSLPAKYRNPATGETWAGRGRVPRWLGKALATGASTEDFRIKE